MTHKAEQIIAAVLGNITNLTTTGRQAYRDRVYAQSELPSLCLEWGPDEKIADLSYPLQDRALTLFVDVRVKQTAQLSTEIMKICNEVTVALMVDITQGLSFVFNTIEGDPDGPDLSGEEEQPTGYKRLPFIFHYRRSMFDPSA